MSCTCILAIIATAIELGETSMHWQIVDQEFSPIELRENAVAFPTRINPPVPGLIRSDESLGHRAEIIGSNSIIPDTLRSITSPTVVTASRTPTRVALNTRTQEGPMVYNEFKSMMDRYRMELHGDNEKEKEDDIGDGLVLSSAQEMVSQRPTRPLVIHPDVQRLTDIKMELYRGNPCNWNDVKRPTSSSELELFYPGTSRDQTTFLIAMGQECQKNGLHLLNNIFLEAAKEILNAKQTSHSPKIPHFTRQLFSLLGRYENHTTSVSTLLNTVWGSIVVPLINENYGARYQPRQGGFNQRPYQGHSTRRSNSREHQRPRSRSRHESRKKHDDKQKRRLYFELNAHIALFIRSACNNAKTSTKALQRALRKGLIIFLNDEDIMGQHGPSASNSEQLVMHYIHQFESGNRKINNKSSFPDSEIFLRYHNQSRHQCSPNCSGHIVNSILRYGWKPSFVSNPSVIRPRVYNLEQSVMSIDKEINSLIQNKKIVKVDRHEVQCILPIKIVLKNDHISRAAELLHMSFHATEKLGADTINTRLTDAHMPVIKTRMVTDFRAGLWNDNLEDVPFSYSSIHEAIALAHSVETPYFVKIDFSQYFFQIPLAEESQNYFGIAHKGIIYRYTALPFGVKTAPLIASLISTEISNLALSLYGIHMITYIDDLLIVSDGLEKATLQKQQILSMLEDINFIVNPDKVIGPLNEMEFLGFVISAKYKPYTLSINFEKCNLIKLKVITAISNGSLSYSDLASLAGSLLFLSEVIFLGWGHTLPLWAAIKGIDSRNRAFTVRFNPYQISCLLWWRSKLNDITPIHLPKISTFPRPRVREFVDATRLFTDASGTDGYSYYTEDKHILGYDIWPDDLTSSYDMMIKELFPLLICLRRHMEFFQGRPLIWLTDNTSAVMTVNAGAARNPEANDIIMEILTMIEQHDVVLLAIWIPREYNQIADYFSHALTCL